MLDPLTHVAHAYHEASGSAAQRLSSALTTIGISVVGGALSTAGACLPLFLCTLHFFTAFGKLLCTLLLVAIIYTNTFLAPLLLLIGPSTRTAAAGGATSSVAVGKVGRLRTAEAFRHRQMDETADGGRERSDTDPVAHWEDVKSAGAELADDEAEWCGMELQATRSSTRGDSSDTPGAPTSARGADCAT